MFENKIPLIEGMTDMLEKQTKMNHQETSEIEMNGASETIHCQNALIVESKWLLG